MSERDRDEGGLIATSSQTVGPFFHFGLATDQALGTIAAAEAGSKRIRLRVRVLDGDGVPVPDALIELYHADARGAYPSTNDGPFSGFGRLATGEDGGCVFETTRPGAVHDGSGAPQAAHVNVCLFARGLLRHLYTRIYFDGDPALGHDPLLGLVPGHRRSTLLARTSSAEPDLWEFTIQLQGEHETVFFDL